MAEIPAIVAAYRKQNAGLSDSEACNRYHQALEKLQAAKADARARLQHAMMCISYLEPMMREMKRDFGGVPPSIPAIPEAAIFHGIGGARGQLENLREFVGFFPDLQDWLPTVEEGFVMLDLAARTRSYLKENPGTLQTKLKQCVGASDGRLLSRVIHYMEVAEQVVREKSGKTWCLALRASADRAA